MALTAERDTKRRDGALMHLPLAAVKVFLGGMACISTATGYCTKGATATTLVAVGIFTETVDNSGGSAGDLSASIDRNGWFKFKNSADADLIARDDIGKDCFIVDDEQVALTNGSNTRSKAGVIRDVDADGVWISFA